MPKSKRDDERDHIKETIRERVSEVQNSLNAPRSLLRSVSKEKTAYDPEYSSLEGEKIFLKGRENVNNPQNWIEECESLAKSIHPIEEIIADNNQTSLKLRYHYLLGLERAISNSEISKLYVPDIEVTDQQSIVQIQLKKFFVLKKLLCLNKSIKLTKNNIDKELMPDNELKKESFKLGIQNLIREAFASACVNEKERKEFIQEIFDEIFSSPLAETLPTDAPELFKERKNRKESPVEFILRVYKLWLGKGLMRPHIKNLDPPLYNSLYQWLNRNPEPSDFRLLLPTAAGRSVEYLSTPDFVLVERRRELARRNYKKNKK